MLDSTRTTTSSCRVDEVFDAKGLTANAGANLLVDYIRNKVNLPRHLAAIPLKKAPWATYTLAQDLECLILLYALGMKRISHADEYTSDPLILAKLGLKRLPHRATFYRTLDRFQNANDVKYLGAVNRHVLGRLVDQGGAILDIDTTVETVYGQQEGASKAYNPSKPGRLSYQPMVAFDGRTGAGVHVEHRSGHSPNAEEKVNFYRQAKAQLPQGITLARGDKAFVSEAFCHELESDDVDYLFKLRMTPGLKKRIKRGTLWKRIPSHESTQIEGCSVRFRASGWSRHRRVVLIRSRLTQDAQPGLFSDLLWDYQAIVTNVDWDPEDVWHCYNQRCTCENYIKELKYGLDIDAIAKADFWPNAADLWIKMITYNLLLSFRNKGCSQTRSYSIPRLRRVLLKVPGIVVRHARRMNIRLPSWWPHQEKWWAMRHALSYP